MLNKTKKYLLLIVVFFIFSLIVLELFSRFYFYYLSLTKPNKAPVHFPIKSWNFSPVDRYQIPQLKSGIKVKSNGIEYKYNLWGHRDIRETPIDKALHIFFTGDSMILGLGIPFEKTVPYLLEKKINKMVYNAGVPGMGTSSELYLIKKLLNEISPKIIILSLYVNDFYDNAYFRNNIYRLNQHRFKIYYKFIQPYLKEYCYAFHIYPKILNLFLKFKYRQQNLSKQKKRKKILSKEDVTYVCHDIKEFASLSKKYGFIPILLIVPSMGIHIRPEYDPIIKKAAQLNIYIMDGYDFFDVPERNSYFLAYDSHLSSKGAEKIAAEIYKFFKKNNIK